MTTEEMIKFCDGQIKSAHDQYMITTIDLNIYKAYIRYYGETITQERENIILKYIHDVILSIVEEDQEKMDPEWVDYYDAFIAGEPYGFEIITSRAIADLLERKLNILTSEMETKTYEESFASIIEENYETDALISPCLHTEISEWNNKIYDFCNLFARQHIDFIAEETGFTFEQLDSLINTVTSPFDQDFSSALVCPHSLIVNETENGLVIAVPNMVFTIIDLLKQIHDQEPIQNNLIIINQTEEEED